MIGFLAHMCLLECHYLLSALEIILIQTDNMTFRGCLSPLTLSQIYLAYLVQSRVSLNSHASWPTGIMCLWGIWDTVCKWSSKWWQTYCMCSSTPKDFSYKTQVQNKQTNKNRTQVQDQIQTQVQHEDEIIKDFNITTVEH